MALLNIASEFKTGYVEDTSYNKALIFTTSDKHIITHGVDFLSDYSKGVRGLIPNYDSDVTDGVLGKEGWKRITTSMLPIADNLSTNNTDAIFTTKQVQDLISQGFAANDAMVFKGVLVTKNADPDNNKFLDVPTSNYSAGWTYRIAEAGTYIGGNVTCEAGDLVIATSDRTDALVSQTTGAEIVDNSQWSVIQTNIKGYVTITINGTAYQFASNTGLDKSKGFVAPETKGQNNQILMTINNELAWANQNVINAGQLNGKTSNDFVTNVVLNSNGKWTFTKGTTTSTAAADIVAANTIGSLTSGDGIIFKNGTDIVNSYNGSSNLTLLLQPASNSNLGGVKIDSTKGTVDSNYSTISISNDGVISLTKENIFNALGFVPTAPNEVMQYNIVSTTADGIVPKMADDNLSNNLITSNYYLLAFDSTSDTSPKWHRLSAGDLSDTWRPVSIDGTPLFTNAVDANNILNFKKGDNVSIFLDGDNSVVISAVDTKYNNATTTVSGLMSYLDKIKLESIEAGAQKNVDAFASIATPSGTLTATTTQDVATFSGENIGIQVVDNTIKFKVFEMVGANSESDGTRGLVPGASKDQRSYYLRGDGTWNIPDQRPIKVGENTLSANGALNIIGSDGVSVDLNTTTKTLTISSKSLSGSEGINVNQNNVISLNEATTNTIGGIKTSFDKLTSDITVNNKSSIANRYYGVELDKNGKAVVNVPWEYESNSWRDIKIGNVSIGDKALRFVTAANGSIGIVASAGDLDASTSDTWDIGFDIFWYNLDTNSYES